MKMKATPQWMNEKYDEMNNLLFDGRLGACNFKVFTTGKGSNGRTLGWFKITGKGIYVEKESRKLYLLTAFGKEYINKTNFFNFCQPTIELNGNYSGTEDALLGTLVHEMCHYYTYMYGIAPKQAHGREFKNIGAYVSSKSNGRFTIQRLASAEEMSNYELDADVAKANEDKLKRRMGKLEFILIKMKDGELRLTNSSSRNLREAIYTSHNRRQDVSYFAYSNDPSLIDYLVAKGYSKAFRTYRYWDITNKPFVKELINFNWNELPLCTITLGEALGVENQEANQEQQSGVENKFNIIKDGNGWNLYDKELKHKVFGQPVDDIKVANNKEEIIFTKGAHTFKGLPGNWKKYNIQENMKKELNRIIRESIQAYLNEDIIGDDSVPINPDMNLGLESPFEEENNY